MLGSSRNSMVVGILAGSAAIALVNASVFTSLLTHGVGLTLAMIYFMPASRDNGCLASDGMDITDSSSSSTLTKNSAMYP